MKKWNTLVNKLNSLEAQLSSNKTNKTNKKSDFYSQLLLRLPNLSALSISTHKATHSSPQSAAHSAKHWVVAQL